METTIVIKYGCDGSLRLQRATDLNRQYQGVYEVQVGDTRLQCPDRQAAMKVFEIIKKNCIVSIC